MKQKTGFLGFLLPFFKRLYLKMRSVNSVVNHRQNLFVVALLILWLLVFLLIKYSPFTIHK
ncbi:hypothetical protein ABIB50_001388 [Mucilaginibacter sp. UYCu711]